jgi:hypothetical protein
MNNNSSEDDVWQELYPRIPRLIKKNWCQWESIGAILGIGCGIFSFFAAMILNVCAWLATQSSWRANLSGTSVDFLIIILPLLALGAHCLDLLEKKTPVLKTVSPKRAYLNRNHRRQKI